MTAKLSAGGRTHRGHVRERNEDVIVVEPDLGLYAVLDGMGGHAAGDVAARMAAEEIAACIRTPKRIHRLRRRLSPRELLSAALDAASAAVFKAGWDRHDYYGMGTTAVACLVVDPTHVVIGHVGDSRAYLLRAGKLTALTRDHTAAQRLVDEGRVSADKLHLRKYREYHHRLTRYLGEGSQLADLAEVALEPGDRLLLCSDGLYGGTVLGGIRRLLGSKDAAKHIARDLVDLALKGAARDNISAVVIAVDGGGARAATPRPSPSAPRSPSGAPRPAPRARARRSRASRSRTPPR
jgi:protein phosphatase